MLRPLRDKTSPMESLMSQMALNWERLSEVNMFNRIFFWSYASARTVKWSVREDGVDPDTSIMMYHLGGRVQGWGLNGKSMWDFFTLWQRS